MRLRRDQRLTRGLGTLVGLGFLALGLWSVVGSQGLLSPVGRGRVFWYGVTLVIGGLAAVLASLTVRDTHALWCRQPRRWGRWRPRP